MLDLHPRIHLFPISPSAFLFCISRPTACTDQAPTSIRSIEPGGGSSFSYDKCATSEKMLKKAKRGEWRKNLYLPIHTQTHTYIYSLVASLQLLVQYIPEHSLSAPYSLPINILQNVSWILNISIIVCFTWCVQRRRRRRCRRHRCSRFLTVMFSVWSFRLSSQPSSNRFFFLGMALLGPTLVFFRLPFFFFSSSKNVDAFLCSCHYLLSFIYGSLDTGRISFNLFYK